MKRKLELAGSSEINLNENVVPCDKILFIKSQSTGMTAGKIFGKVLMVGGLIFTGTGGLLIIIGFTHQNLASVILVPFGIIITAAGGGGTLVGTSLLFLTRKKYDIENDWNLEVIEVSEN